MAQYEARQPGPALRIFAEMPAEKCPQKSPAPERHTAAFATPNDSLRNEAHKEADR